MRRAVDILARTLLIPLVIGAWGAFLMVLALLVMRIFPSHFHHSS